jgi:hypothetical protein
LAEPRAIDAVAEPGNASAHVGTTQAAAPARKPADFIGTLDAAPARKLDTAILRSQTKDALTALGWKPAIASAAVAAAAAEIGPEATLERWIFAALRRCPAPRA